MDTQTRTTSNRVQDEGVEDYNERRVRYYDCGAHDYDGGWRGSWLPNEGERAEFEEELGALGHTISSLPAGWVLDVACGTGVLTRYLKGEVTGLDGSEEMLKIARERVPGATFVQGGAFSIPFPDSSFVRVFTSNFYGLLLPHERSAFLKEVRRIAPELVVVEVVERDMKKLGWRKRETGWQERTLSDGSEHLIYRRYFTAKDLARELAGEVLFDGRYLVMVRATRKDHQR
jgi:SAM-dependent methyltransferase